MYVWPLANASKDAMEKQTVVKIFSEHRDAEICQQKAAQVGVGETPSNKSLL